METCVGKWYLCESYIEEPVLVEALESDKLQVRYLLSGKTRWLGYPRIWHACKPHPLTYKLEYDSGTQQLTVMAVDESEEPQQMSLSQLRMRLLPKTARPRLVSSRRAAAASRKTEVRAAWSDENDSASEDEEYLTFDMSL